VLNRKVMLVGVGVVGTLATSERARRYSSLSLRWAGQKGRSAVALALGLSGPVGADLAADGVPLVADLPQGFANAVQRGIEGYVPKVLVPAGAMAVEQTNPDGWESALFAVERGMDGTWEDPKFKAPAFKTVEDIHRRGQWAEVRGPVSPAMGTEAVPVVPLSSIGDIPDPWPVGSDVPVLPVLRRPRRFDRTLRFMEQQTKSDRAMGLLHRKWADDEEGRAAVHIANDPVGLHNELTRSGRIRMKGLPWQQRERTTGGKIRTAFGRAWSLINGTRNSS